MKKWFWDHVFDFSFKTNWPTKTKVFRKTQKTLGLLTGNFIFQKQLWKNNKNGPNISKHIKTKKTCFLIFRGPLCKVMAILSILGCFFPKRYLSLGDTTKRSKDRCSKWQRRASSISGQNPDAILVCGPFFSFSAFGQPPLKTRRPARHCPSPAQQFYAIAIALLAHTSCREFEQKEIA